jgi:DNA-binding HxlR family transcriptional regulator
MRSYGQYCALAKALDLVGDRWTLLIVRELLIRGGCRYTDLREGLPGIATNLLVDRLKEMEKAGLVRREVAPPPVATTLFHLTPRARELEPAIYLLGQWGAPLLAHASKEDVFKAHWLVLPMRHWLKDHSPDEPPVRIELRAGDESIAVETVKGSIATRMGTVDRPDAVISGPAPVIAALLKGKIDLEQARESGVRFDGAVEALRRVQPLAVAVRN